MPNRPNPHVYSIEIGVDSKSLIEDIMANHGLEDYSSEPVGGILSVTWISNDPNCSGKAILRELLSVISGPGMHFNS